MQPWLAGREPYVPSFLPKNPESSSMDDPHALCLYLFLHVSKPDPTNKMEMMMSSPILPPHIIFFHQLTAVHTSCLHHFTASKTASRILKPCHFCLLLLIVEAGMQLSLLLLLQHSHSLSTLPVVDIKSLQTKVQASSPDVGATDFEWIRTYALLIYTHQQELMKAMGRTMAAARHCSLVFMMKKKVMGSLTCCLQLS
jgi:hypothetical protein